MKASDLKNATDVCIEATRAALQALWDSIIKGQRKQLIKNGEVAEMLTQYGVDTNV